jgi:2-amino-4-hydroxy-6-hydroxymethyldihydropteridine diphosphokinase
VNANRWTRRAVLALGSNVGNRFEFLQAAVDMLVEAPGVEIVAVSPVYETAPVGGPADQDLYLNAVIVADTTLSAPALLERCLAIERACGRRRTMRWDPRTLDIDMITYGEEVRTDEKLTLPHPRASERPFVLVPWLSVDAAAVLPGIGRIADLPGASRDEDIVQRSDLSLHVPPGAPDQGLKVEQL